MTLIFLGSADAGNRSIAVFLVDTSVGNGSSCKMFVHVSQLFAFNLLHDFRYMKINNTGLLTYCNHQELIGCPPQFMVEKSANQRTNIVNKMENKF